MSEIDLYVPRKVVEIKHIGSPIQTLDMVHAD